MTCVTVHVDTRIVVYGGFSPAELHQLAPQMDILAPRQEPVAVADTVVARLCPSMLHASFETLHCFWKPLSSSSVQQQQQQQPPPQSPTPSPSSSLSLLLPPAFSLSGADVLISGSTSCMRVSWNSRRSYRSISEDVVSDEGVWFRFVSTFPHRKYTLDRSPKQLAILLDAMRVSFLHLLVPTSKGELSIHAARCLLDFVQTHVEMVCAFLPLLYFLFEVDEKSVANFFTSLEELVRRRQLHERNLFNSLMPRDSSWFGWGTPKATPKIVDLAEDLVFMDAHTARLPPRLKWRFFVSQSRMEVVKRARMALTSLRESLLEEVEAFTAVTVLCEYSKSGLLCDVWNGLGADAAHQAGQAKDTSETQIVKAAIAEFMHVSNVLQEQIFGPILGTLVDTMRTTELTVVAQNEYLQSVLECAKRVVQNEPFLADAGGLQKSSQAAQRPGLLLQVNELYKKVCLAFGRCKTHLEDEMSLSERAMNKLLFSCCVQCFHAFTTFYDVFDARHHTKLIPPGGRQGSSLHPLLQVFRETEEKEDSAQFLSEHS